MKWSQIENHKYITFIQKNRSSIDNQDKSKRSRIFNKMALYIKTRNPIQCRSHHQKLLKYYKTIEGIIKHLKGQETTQS